MTKPLYFWNGSSFELVGPTTPQSPFAYQTSAPTAPATGDIWIDSDGDVDTYNRQLTRYYFVASTGQTSVSGTDANGLTLAYVAGSEQVYVNGALQVRGVDYTATNGTSITGLSALALNDVVEVFAYTAFTVANAYTKTETDSVAAAAPGMRLIVPSSVAVGSGTGSANAAGFVTFSGASSVSLNDVFSSTYDNYAIKIYTSTASGTTAFNMRLRVSGADNSTSAYATSLRFMDSASNFIWDLSAVSQSTWRLTSNIYSGFPSYTEVLISNPFGATATNIINNCVVNRNSSTGAVENYFGASSFGATTSFTGFTLYPTSGTVTGTVGVYGYKD